MRALAATLLLLLATGCTGDNQEPGSLRPCKPDGVLSLNEKLPDCEFRHFDGSTFRLQMLEGTPSVLNFWASWCEPCLKEMPDFQDVSDELGSQATIVGFNMLGVDGEIESAARRFAIERKVTYPLVFDRDGLFYAHFAVAPALPTTVLVDANGRVIHRQFGPLDKKELRALIRKHLKV